MVGVVTHATVVAVPDDPNYPVGSNDWNAPHVITGLAPLDAPSFTTSLTITGSFTVTGGPATITGNASVTGTMSVSGLTTSGTMTSTGLLTAGSISTAGTLAAGNTTITGTLGVSGLTTSGTMTSTGLLTAGSISTAGTLGAGATTVSGLTSTAGVAATTGIGYRTGAGAGGTVTQLTSRGTGVTINTPSGAITLFAGAPVVGTWTSFTVTNSSVAATDTVSVSVKSATNTYQAAVTLVAAGSFNISFVSVSGTTSDSPVINFNVIKGSSN